MRSQNLDRGTTSPLQRKQILLDLFIFVVPAVDLEVPASEAFFLSLEHKLFLCIEAELHEEPSLLSP